MIADKRKSDSKDCTFWDDKAGILVDHVNQGDWLAVGEGKRDYCRHFTFKLGVLLYAIRVMGLESEIGAPLRSMKRRLWKRADEEWWRCPLCRCASKRRRDCRAGTDRRGVGDRDTCRSCRFQGAESCVTGLLGQRTRLRSLVSRHAALSLDRAVTALDHGDLISVPRAEFRNVPEAHRMSLIFHELWIRKILRGLVPAIVVVVGLLGRVEASEFAALSASSQAADHAEICKCGNKCQGGSCCCGHQQKSTRAQVRPIDGESTAMDANPCVSSAPCGESGLPRRLRTPARSEKPRLRPFADSCCPGPPAASFPLHLAA